MDKEFSNNKISDAQTNQGKEGLFCILMALSFICASLFFLNLSLSFSDNENASKVSEAILAASKKLEENEAISVFLGLDYEYPEEEIY